MADISRNFNTTLKDLFQLNTDAQNAQYIAESRTLEVSKDFNSRGTFPSSSNASSALQEPTDEHESLQYGVSPDPDTDKDRIITITVTTGQTLTILAREHNTTVDEILKLNQCITNKDYINVGQKLLVRPNSAK